MALVAEQHRFYRLDIDDLPASYNVVFCNDKPFIYSNHHRDGKDKN
jgi:hypothetical protein